MKPTKTMLTAGLGGALATGADVGSLVLLVQRAHLAIPVATFLAAMIGAVVNFVANKYIAFRDHTPVDARQVGTFAGVALTTALFMAFAMKLVAVKLGVPYVLAKLLCAAAIFLVWTYPAQRRLVFSNRPAVA